MLHKVGKPKEKALTYQHLRLTSCAGKILQKLVTNGVKTWVAQNTIFNREQNYFRKNRCNNNKLFNLAQSVKQNFNKNVISTAFF